MFTSLDYQSAGFDWSILSVALETLEHFLGRIDDASEEQYSSEHSNNVDAVHVEDAVLVGSTASVFVSLRYPALEANETSCWTDNWSGTSFAWAALC